MELTSEKKTRRKNTSEINYGKVPPNDKEIEKSILGGMISYPNSIPEVINLIFSEVFYVESHKDIFQSIVNLYDQNKSIDVFTIGDDLRKNDKLDSVGGIYYINSLVDVVPSGAKIDTHCRIIIEHFLKREMIKISQEAIISSYDDSTDSFELFDKTDNDILLAQEKILTGQIRDMKHYSSKVVEEYHQVKEVGILGTQTGIAPIDKILSGIVSPDLFVIAARPSQGKTALAMSISHYISVENKIPGAWFSLEMNGVQLTRRLASLDSDIPHEQIRNGKMSQENEIKFYESINKISSSPIFIEDRGSVNVRSIRTRSNILVRKNKIKYIIVDYLQLMEGVDPRNKNRNDIVSEITRGLKLLAMDLNICVIALSQLSREVEKRDNKMPQLSDLRESGGIEQDADNVLFLMRPERYGFINDVEFSGRQYPVRGLCIGKIDKNRHGECVNFPMSFKGSTMRLSTHQFDNGNTQQSSGWIPSTSSYFSNQEDPLF